MRKHKQRRSDVGDDATSSEGEPQGQKGAIERSLRRIRYRRWIFSCETGCAARQRRIRAEAQSRQ